MFLLPQQIIDARANASREPWKSFANEMREAADGMCSMGYSKDIEDNERGLFRAREFCRAVTTLAGTYIYSGQEKYAERAWTLIEESFQWEYWCAEPSVNDLGEPVEIDLAVGEMAFTIANALTLLGGWLSAGQRARLVEESVERVFKPYLALVDTQDERHWPWWYLARMNWNSVCNGGILCLALCLEKEEASAKRAIPCALRALDEFIDSLHEDGSGEEGIGYWLYGHLYHLYAGIAYENATGEKWSAFDTPKLINALDFPFDFSPDEAGLSFNDVNWFNPTGALYAMINRTGADSKVHALTKRLLDFRKRFDAHPVYVLETAYMWPSEIFALCFCRDEYAPERVHGQMSPVKVYSDNGWGLFTAKGGLRLALRSGNSGVNHGCRDLNAIQVSRKRALLIENVGNHPYPEGWFGEGRKVFFEDSTAAKSAMLVNGIGQLRYDIAEFGYDEKSMWSQAAHAYPKFMKCVKRTVHIEGEGLMIEDDFENDETVSRVYHEIRFYTAGRFLQEGPDAFSAENGGERLVMRFESDTALGYRLGQSIPSMPTRPALHMLRVFVWNPQTKSRIITHLS